MPSISSVTISGLETVLVCVEADVSFGLGAFNIVGLPDAAVKESRDRIRSAIKHSNLSFPRWRVTVNLAPADLKKQGPLYDLPIALAVLLAEKELAWKDFFSKSIFIGELGLEGEIRPVRGAFAAALAAKQFHYPYVFLPRENLPEADLVEGVHPIPVTSLSETLEILRTQIPSFKEGSPQPLPTSSSIARTDFADVRGQNHAKRGLEIAAAGGHNVLLFGPPGSGKTLLARTLSTILPSLSQEEALEVTKIHSIAGDLPMGHGILHERPFRSPHHSSSAVALVGGGSVPRPGETTLAHRGVLFLDELPEFNCHVLEQLRQPMEDGVVVIARAAGSVQFPCRFMLVGAMNPCPCGYAGDPRTACSCSPMRLTKYRKKISGPLLDRIDLTIPVPRVETEKLMGVQEGETSVIVQKRVETARALQLARLQSSGLSCNAELSPTLLRTFCGLDASGEAILRSAADRLRLSARSFSRLLKVARTVADLADSDRILPEHISEALSYRPSPFIGE